MVADYGLQSRNIIIIFLVVNQIKHVAKISSKKPGVEGIIAAGYCLGNWKNDGRFRDSKTEAEK